MPRELPEWIGATPDTPVPPRVRLRVLNNFGNRCDPRPGYGGCGRILRAGDKWTCDHFKSLISDGENREMNLHPLCEWCCPIKDASDVAEKSKDYRVRAKHFGVRGRHRTIAGRKFDGTPIPARWVNG